MTTDKTHPEDTLRDGNVKATIWKNHGEQRDYYSTTFARTYTDRDGNPRDAYSFSGTDLLKLSELAKQSYSVTRDLYRQNNQDRIPSHDDDKRAQFISSRQNQRQTTARENEPTR